MDCTTTTPPTAGGGCHRLLDWTIDPLVAAFWAAWDGGRNETSDELCVWALNRSAIDLTPAVTNGVVSVHELPSAGSAYIHAQKGLFTFTYGAHDYFMEHDEWPDLVTLLETMERHHENLPVLRKLTLPTSEAERLLLLLGRERITKSFMMPTLDNIAAAVVDQLNRELDEIHGRYMMGPEGGQLWQNPRKLDSAGPPQTSRN